MSITDDNIDMYKVEKTSYGFRMAIKGDFNQEEMIQFYNDVKSFRAELPEIFSGFIDARELMVFNQESKKGLMQLEGAFIQMGCSRFAVILKSPVVSSQLKQVAFESNNAEGERQINAANNDNWEQLGLDWVIDGIEPSENSINMDKQPQTK